MNDFAHGSRSKQPHFVLVPLMAQGHTIPMIDLAHLLASHGALVTFVTTPLNARRIESVIQHAKESQLPIEFLPFTFNYAEAGLPEGTENLDMLRHGLQEFAAFLEMCFSNKDPLISYLREHETPPSCVISDLSQPWTGEVAREFGIPRIGFLGMSAFATLCWDITILHKIYDNVTDENEPVPIPGFPHPLEIPKTKSIVSFYAPGLEKVREKIAEENSKSEGIIVNTFLEMESLYIDSYEKLTRKKAWAVGPMCLYNKGLKQMLSRGNKASIDEERCIKWLDSMEKGSVMFVNFGSIANIVPLQVMEIGLSIEASRKPFIWVLKAADKMPEIEQWLIEENFEERVKYRGLIIKGWAPQFMILSHKAVGGFLTHCGWNSIIESICNGVPMLTWPQFGDQFLNEILVADVLKIGIKIGVERSVVWGSEKSDEVMVKRDDMERKVLELMDEGKEGMERRVRARELGDKAKAAMEEGGSSYKNIELLIKVVV
ncbi:Glycosyltransferase [Rhynchospora pubera]|uniref:Glycosyltransferase n=1 Tax=Rhynchospora pubera TaxID=906938 RepID=A0AAV8EFY0_9POAL|nr:Glycosyltransferase [Rhynchospora pubera]KAJ4787251.1 Glycosyltransferase [Rhynchospora pubera]